MPDVYLPYQNNLNRQRNDLKSLMNNVPALNRYNPARDLVADQNVLGADGKNQHRNRVISGNHTADLQIKKDFNEYLLRTDMALFEKDEYLENKNPIALPYWKGGFFTRP